MSEELAPSHREEIYLMWTGTRFYTLVVLAFWPETSVCLYAQLNSANSISGNVEFDQCSSTELKCGRTIFSIPGTSAQFGTFGIGGNYNQFKHENIFIKSDETGCCSHPARLWIGSAGGNAGSRFSFFQVYANTEIYWGSTNAAGTSTSYVYHSTMGSDSRIKLNQLEVEPSKSMEIVDALKVKQYYNTQKKRTSIGFIAQEAAELVPEAVKAHNLIELGLQPDHLMLDYRRLCVHTFGAIQYLDSEIQNLEERLAALQST